jgi:hypothetical protein
MGVVFFFLMLFDSHVERRLAIPSTLGLPRWHKRVSYYLFKICYLQNTAKKLSIIPSYKIRKFLVNSYSNEYEKLKYYRIIFKSKKSWRKNFKKLVSPVLF